MAICYMTVGPYHGQLVQQLALKRHKARFSSTQHGKPQCVSLGAEQIQNKQPDTYGSFVRISHLWHPQHLGGQS